MQATHTSNKIFTVEIDGKPVEFLVKKPDHRVSQKAQQVHNRAFREAVESGAIVRARIEAVMRDQGLWDNNKQERYEATVKRLLENEKKLAKGGIKLSEAKEVAVQMRRDRLTLRDLNGDRHVLDQNTAEAQAENARFNFLVSATTQYADTGKLYFKDHEDYLSREDDPVATPAATNLGKLLYNLEDDYERKLPENAWLLKYGFANEKLHLIDKKTGRPCDTQGRPVDDKGRLINEKGELVDAEGNQLDEDGNYIGFKFVEFIDDISESVAPAIKKVAEGDPEQGSEMSEDDTENEEKDEAA